MNSKVIKASKTVIICDILTPLLSLKTQTQTQLKANKPVLTGLILWAESPPFDVCAHHA